MNDTTLGGIVRDAGIDINLDDIKQALGHSDIEYGAGELEFLSSMGVQNPPSQPVNPFRTPTSSRSSSPSASQAIGIADYARRRVDQYLPESFRKKVKEAGGSPADFLRFPIQAREEKEEKEEKIRGPIRGPISGLFGDMESEDMESEDMESVAIEMEDEGDPRDAIARQINSINMKLEEVSRGGKSSYPEQRKTKRAYRFPRANDNYSAIKLVQNSTTNYLNDMNMYGNDNELVIDEI
jgi:hypothetical protein